MNMANNLSVNNVVLTVLAVSIGIVLVGSLLAPIASDVMSDLITLDGGADSGDGHTWASLVGVTVVISILGLVIVAVNQYTKNK